MTISSTVSPLLSFLFFEEKCRQTYCLMVSVSFFPGRSINKHKQSFIINFKVIKNEKLQINCIFNYLIFKVIIGIKDIDSDKRIYRFQEQQL